LKLITPVEGADCVLAPVVNINRGVRSKLSDRAINRVLFLYNEDQRGFFIYFYKNCTMTSKISEGVEVSVESFYQPDYSNPVSSEYMFAYRITIENHNAFPVKLLRRHWHIFDSNGQHREVEGEGVVGVQPELVPGERYQYVSGCNLRTEMGKMYGTYSMENLNSKQMFEVNIPAFEMMVPFKNN
jgi:ApaG protein